MTTCTNVTSPYFNPDTPMVSLPPDSAEQYVAGTYVAVAVIGVSAASCHVFGRHYRFHALNKANGIGLVHGRVSQYTR